MRRIGVIVVFTLCFSGALFAEEPAAPPPRDPIIWDLGVRLLGADIGIGWRGLTQVPNPDTILWLIVGGGYEWPAYFRDASNQLYTGGGFATGYTRINGRLDLGLAQGFFFNDRLKFNLFEAFVFYKLRLDYVPDDQAASELILASGLPDAGGLFQNSILAGLSYNDLDKTAPHRVLSGVYAELSAEWGPEFLFNAAYGRSDFIRLNLTAKGFLPLFDNDPGAELNSLSGYVGGFFSIDWCDGNSVPINVQQTFGGRKPRQGLGYAVRGYEDGRFDGRFKAVLDLEFRLNLPQFKVVDTFTPGILVFADSGYFNFLYYNEQGFLFSLGAGVFLDVWKLTTLCIYTIVDLARPRMDGSYWLPVYFGLDAHF